MSTAICFVVLVASAFVLHANCQLPDLLKDPCVQACVDALLGCKVSVCAKVAEKSKGVSVDGCLSLYGEVGAGLCATLCLPKDLLSSLTKALPLPGGLPVGRK